MANKALWEVLDNIHISYDDYDYDVLVDQIQTAVGDDYQIDIWDHDDYAASDIVESVICWTNDNCKRKVLEDLQVGTLWTEEEDKCFTIVILKAKEI
jgi:hypothetical protein